MITAEQAKDFIFAMTPEKLIPFLVDAIVEREGDSASEILEELELACADKRDELVEDDEDDD